MEINFIGVILLLLMGYLTGVITLSISIYFYLKKENALYLWNKKKYPKEES